MQQKVSSEGKDFCFLFGSGYKNESDFLFSSWNGLGRRQCQSWESCEVNRNTDSSDIFLAVFWIAYEYTSADHLGMSVLGCRVEIYSSTKDSSIPSTSSLGLYNHNRYLQSSTPEPYVDQNIARVSFWQVQQHLRFCLDLFLFPCHR